MEAEDGVERRIAMSEREGERLKVLERLREGLIGRRRAAAQLRLSERQVRRLKRRYEREGAAGLISRRQGKPSNRRTPERLKAAIRARVQERYADFGPLLAAEYLRAEGFRLSKEALGGWMIAARGVAG